MITWKDAVGDGWNQRGIREESESRVNINRVNKQSKDNMNINIINKYNVL